MNFSEYINVYKWYPCSIHENEVSRKRSRLRARDGCARCLRVIAKWRTTFKDMGARFNLITAERVNKLVLD